MSDVIAKFRVDSVEYYSYPAKSHSVKLSAVYPSKNDTNMEENKRFSEATPSGQITMFISNPAVYDTFKPGDEFYVEFSRVPKVQP